MIRIYFEGEIHISCFICDKQLGITDQPPGGYFYEDEHWKVCQFPAQQSGKGGIG